jgi:hypothetical protein
MMKDFFKTKDKAEAVLIGRPGAEDCVKMKGFFEFECFDKFGNLKWRDKGFNDVVNEGLDHILDVVLHGDTPTSPWYVGLTDGTPTVAAADTMASHAGWTEVTDYSGNRQEYVEAAASGQSITNSASKASFSITGTATVGGAFLTADATGTAGVLLCAVAFTGGDKSVANGDTLQVTYTLSAADS